LHFFILYILYNKSFSVFIGIVIFLTFIFCQNFPFLFKSEFAVFSAGFPGFRFVFTAITKVFRRKTQKVHPGRCTLCQLIFVFELYVLIILFQLI